MIIVWIIVAIAAICFIVTTCLDKRDKVCPQCSGKMVLKTAENWGEIDPSKPYICEVCLHEE